MTADPTFLSPPAPVTSTRTMKEQLSLQTSDTSSVESLPAPTTKSPEKTWPSRSAGPHFPVLPLTEPLLRLIPGDPRYALPPIEFVSKQLHGPLLLEASFSDDHLNIATVVLPPSAPNPIPDHWFDFNVPHLQSCKTYITFTLRACNAMCQVVVLLSEFSARKGVLRRPMLDPTNTPIACLTLDFIYATAHPLGKNGAKIPFVPRFTGHRGMGSSGPTAPWRVPENSIESFAMAALPDTAVKTVELDVQITRDNKPVIYHDWFFRPRGATGHPVYDASSVKIPIYDMTFDQFDKLYRQSYAGQNVLTDDPARKRVDFRNWARKNFAVPDDAFDLRLRTLRETCEMLPSEIGMLVELKYPPPDIHHGRIPYPEKNQYIDLVLEELLTTEANNERKIAFLTFDADLSMLLSLKQSKYPVYLSHCEVLDKPCDEYDPRTIDISEGLKFAQSQRLDGLMLFNEIVDEKPEAIAEIVSKRLPIITYGKKNCEEGFVQKQFGMGVSGIIADDIDALMQDMSIRTT